MILFAFCIYFFNKILFKLNLLINFCLGGDKVLIDDNLLFCEKNMLEENLTLYYCFKDLPLKKRYSSYVLYNFWIEVKKAITFYNDIEILDDIESKLLQFQSGLHIKEPMWIALRGVFNEYDMSIQPFKNMINGNRLNLDFKGIISMDDLTRYCFYDGSSFGLMLMPIFKKENMDEEEIDLLTRTISELWNGVKMISILKDLRSDVENGRTYLPASLFQRFKYSKIELSKGIINNNFTNIWEFIANYALNNLAVAEKNLYLFSDDCIQSVRLTIEMNRGILEEIRNNKYNYNLNTKFDMIRKFKMFNENVAPANIY